MKKNSKTAKNEEKAPTIEEQPTVDMSPEKPAERAIDEVMSEWEEAKNAEYGASLEADRHQLRRLSAEDDIARRLVAKGKGSAVVMPDGVEYTARQDGDRYRLQRARQIRRVTLD